MFPYPALWFNSGYIFTSVSRISTTSYLAVTCSVFAFRVQDSGLFWVLTSENVPVFSAYWFNTGYMSTSVYGGFWYFFTYFLRQGGPRIAYNDPAGPDSDDGDDVQREHDDKHDTSSSYIAVDTANANEAAELARRHMGH